MAFLLLAAACGQSALAQTSPTPTAEPEQSITPTVTETPSVTATPTAEPGPNHPGYDYRLFAPSLTRAAETPTPSPTPPPIGGGLRE